MTRAGELSSALRKTGCWSRLAVRGEYAHAFTTVSAECMGQQDTRWHTCVEQIYQGPKLPPAGDRRKPHWSLICGFFSRYAECVHACAHARMHACTHARTHAGAAHSVASRHKCSSRTAAQLSSLRCHAIHAASGTRVQQPMQEPTRGMHARTYACMHTGDGGIRVITAATRDTATAHT